MTTIRLSVLYCGIVLLGACTKEPPPRTVSEFMENPILLEAAVVRCSQNRAEMKYEVECVNARDAVGRIAAKEEQARRAALEAESERKRQEYRQTQLAAAEARRRREEAAQNRAEAEYLSQFDEVPPDIGGADVSEPAANVPGVVIPRAVDETVDGERLDENVAVDGGNAPTASQEPPSDLNAIREELRRRSEQQGNE